MCLTVAHIGAICSAMCALMWAVSVILFRKGGEKVAPLQLNIFKGSVGLILLIFTMLAAEIPFIPPDISGNEWLVLIISGILGIGIADTLFFLCLNKLGAGLTAIVDSSYTPLVFLCSFLILHEPISVALFIAMALMAAAILIGTWEKGNGDQSALEKKERLVAVFQGITSMFLVAFGIVIAKPILDHSDPVWVVSVRLAGGMAFLAIQGMLPKNRRATFKVFRPSSIWRYTLPGAVISMYFSMLFWVMGMQRSLTVTASVINQSSTLMLMAFATIFLKEPFTWRKGVAIILGFAAGILAAIEPAL